VCLCLSASISPELHVLFMYVYVCLHMSVARFSSGGVGIFYVLPVLWMTLCLHAVARNMRRNSDSIGSSVDLSPWRILKLTHQGAASYLGRSLISTFALFNL